MRRSILRLGIASMTWLVLFGVSRPAAAAPEGTVTWGVHITLASRWLDPAETEGIITPFMFVYALHDAVVKPMPGGWNTLSLVESWSQSKVGLTYEFVLRKGVKFHNGDPVTAEDVKFSYDRYRGAGVKLLKDRVREVQIVDPGRIRFVLKEPWPDFMTFYGTSATGGGWVVPKKYVEKVGDDGFKKAPIGAGPYRFVSFTPGIELVLEAYEGYWRKMPSVKRLVLRSLSDGATRAGAVAMSLGERRGRRACAAAGHGDRRAARFVSRDRLRPVVRSDQCARVSHHGVAGEEAQGPRRRHHRGPRKRGDAVRGLRLQ